MQLSALNKVQKQRKIAPLEFSEIFGNAECEIMCYHTLWNISLRSMWNEICPHSRQRIFHTPKAYFTLLRNISLARRANFVEKSLVIRQGLARSNKMQPISFSNLYIRAYFYNRHLWKTEANSAHVLKGRFCKMHQTAARGHCYRYIDSARALL